MTLVINLIDALAWPGATLAVACLFRREIRQALGRIGQVKYNGFELTFRDDLARAEAIARTVPSPPPSIILESTGPAGEPPMSLLIGLVDRPGPPDHRRETLGRLAARSPREAVAEAWSDLARSLARVDRNQLSEAEGRLVDLLRSLRDLAASMRYLSPSPDEARRYVELALASAARVATLG